MGGTDGGGRVIPTPLRPAGEVGVEGPAGTPDAWIGSNEEVKPGAGRSRSPGERDRHPGFEVGDWRFFVCSQDPGLMAELHRLCCRLAASPRPEVDFTVRLIRYTEQGRLPGWGWNRERISGS